ncbi:MAG: DNA-binding response regulator, partial [Gammaproteobacteria bacterium]|nr:DNA-binding response regulator [Gammaproteobacteria bacterium]
MRVLVVEDDVRIAGQVTETLRGAGYVVESAGEGEEAQFLGETEDYDAVVL